jgi:hypothetical protein
VVERGREAARASSTSHLSLSTLGTLPNSNPLPEEPCGPEGSSLAVRRGPSRSRGQGGPAGVGWWSGEWRLCGGSCELRRGHDGWQCPVDEQLSAVSLPPPRPSRKRDGETVRRGPICPRRTWNPATTRQPVRRADGDAAAASMFDWAGRRSGSRLRRAGPAGRSSETSLAPRAGPGPKRARERASDRLLHRRLPADALCRRQRPLRPLSVSSDSIHSPIKCTRPRRECTSTGSVCRHAAP